MTPVQAGVGVVILAAGKGTRMKSDKAKVLHELRGRPMVNYVVASAREVAAGPNVVVVVGHQAETVRAAVDRDFEDVAFALQEEQLGTGHAVQCALPCLPPGVDQVVILCGDVPLISGRAIRRLIDTHREAGRDLTVLAVRMENPTGYGRIVVDEAGRVTGIVEEADATDEQKRIRIVNSGMYCVSRGILERFLGKIRSDNKQGEFYLTDIMGIGHGEGRSVGAMVWDDHREVLGVNTLAELERAETIMKKRLAERS